MCSAIEARGLPQRFVRLAPARNRQMRWRRRAITMTAMPNVNAQSAN